MKTDNQMGSSSNNSNFPEHCQLINNLYATVNNQYEGYNNILTTTDARLAIVEQERATNSEATRSAIATIKRIATVKQLEVKTKRLQQTVPSSI